MQPASITTAASQKTGRAAELMSQFRRKERDPVMELNVKGYVFADRRICGRLRKELSMASEGRHLAVLDVSPFLGLNRQYYLIYHRGHEGSARYALLSMKNTDYASLSIRDRSWFRRSPFGAAEDVEEPAQADEEKSEDKTLRARRSKYSAQQARSVKNMLAAGACIKDITATLGVSNTFVTAVRAGFDSVIAYYDHLATLKGFGSYHAHQDHLARQKGFKSYYHMRTDDQVGPVIRLLAARGGMPLEDIAAALSLTDGAVRSTDAILKHISAANTVRPWFMVDRYGVITIDKGHWFVKSVLDTGSQAGRKGLLRRPQ